MVRRVKAYLANMKVITDEERLHALSVDCEPHAGAVAIAAAVPLGGSRGRRHPSPTLSTTSSASSTSEQKSQSNQTDYFYNKLRNNSTTGRLSINNFSSISNAFRVLIN